MENTKLYLCHRCQQELPADQFYFRRSKVVRPCKPCKAAYYKEWTKSNPQYHKEWHTEHPDKNRNYVSKYRKGHKEEKEK